MAKLKFNTGKKLRKIPILITKWKDENKGYRAEISDSYENYKPMEAEKINFEDLSFHFSHNTDTHENDHLLFNRKMDAVECAKYVNKTYLNGCGKIWN